MMSMGRSCVHKDPSFSKEPATDQAKCLCSDNNGQYAPNSFDDFASSCYDLQTSGIVTIGSGFSKTFVDFCTKNVDAGPTTSSSGVRNTLKLVL